jgi:HEAT repeat protein
MAELPETCPFIAPESVLDRTGPLPSALLAASSYAFYCSGALFALRLSLQDSERPDDGALCQHVEDQVRKLEHAVRHGRAVVKRLSPALTALRSAAANFPHTQAANAHLAALELAAHAVACVSRPERRGEVGLTEAEFCRLEREITWEACKLAAEWKEEDEPSGPPDSGGSLLSENIPVQNLPPETVADPSPAVPARPATAFTHANDRVLVIEDDSDRDYLLLWMEKLLPADEYARLSTALIWLTTEGRPTPDLVRQKIDVIRRTHPDEPDLHPEAFVVADRDYRHDEELEEEAKKCAGTKYVNQTWHVWERVEVENYLLCPGAMIRHVIGRAASADGRFPTPTEDDVRQAIEEAVEASWEAARNQLVSTFARVKKGLGAAGYVMAAEKLLAGLWIGDKRLCWCDAKEEVLPRLSSTCKSRWNVSLSEADLIRGFLPEEVPDEIHSVVREIVAFLNRSLWLTVTEDSRQAVRSLDQALRNKNAAIRRTAAESLGEHGRAALGALKKALRDADVEVRRAAVLSVARIGREATPAVAALIAALQDDDLEVRQRAAAALGVIGPDAACAIPSLLQALTNDTAGSVRQHAASALGSIRAAEGVIPGLTAALGDPDANVRATAAEALGKIGPPAHAALPRLLAAVADGVEYVRQNVAFALGRLGPQAPQVLTALLGLLKDPHRDPRRFAARALSDLGPDAASAVDTLVEALGDPDGYVRADAAEALGKIGPPPIASIPALTQALCDDFWQVRHHAAKALARFGTEASEATGRLEDVAGNDSSGLVRVAAAASLASICGQAERAVGLLVTLLNHSELNTRAATAEALRSVGSAAAAAVPELIARLGDGDWQVRAAAAETLGELGAAAVAAVRALAVAFLEDYKAPDASARIRYGDGPIYDLVRHHAARALGKIGPAAQGALPALRSASAYQSVVCAAAEEAIRLIESSS